MTYLLIGLQDCWCCFCQFIFHVYVLDDQIMHKLTRIRGALSPFAITYNTTVVDDLICSENLGESLFDMHIVFFSVA